jgi:hypothetical protein
VALVVTGLEERIIELIPKVRAEHHACTARHLSNALGMHHTHISGRLRLMQAKGIIAFTDMPGSVHLVGTVEMLADGTVIDPPEVVVPEPRPKRVLGADRAKIEARREREAAEKAAAKTTKAAATKKAAAAKKPTA